jgi:hypothetical protein
MRYERTPDQMRMIARQSIERGIRDLEGYDSDHPDWLGLHASIGGMMTIAYLTGLIGFEEYNAYEEARSRVSSVT